jgi:putative phosphoesterase
MGAEPRGGYDLSVNRVGVRGASGGFMDLHLAQAEQLRVGLIADTHMPGTIKQLWPQVHAAFDGVDCILHAGDLHVPDVIDELDRLAPTFVCRGNGDLGIEHDKLRDSWVGRLAGVQVGLIHRFPTPRRATGETLQRKLNGHFPDADPRVVIYGHTHVAEIHQVDGRVYINPGSPTLPNNQSTRHGTLGILAISNGDITVEVFQIGEGGLTLTLQHAARREQP